MIQQKFDLRPIPSDELFAAANDSQALLRHPLVEMRLFTQEEVIHWEFNRWRSFVSSTSGLEYEAELMNNVEWAERINEKTGLNKDIITKALEVYPRMLHH